MGAIVPNAITVGGIPINLGDLTGGGGVDTNGLPVPDPFTGITPKNGVGSNAQAEANPTVIINEGGSSGYTLYILAGLAALALVALVVMTRKRGGGGGSHHRSYHHGR